MAQQSPEQYLYKDVHSTIGKPPIDFAAIDNWLWMPGSRVAISDNGLYWSHMTAKANGADARTIIQTTEGEIRYTLNTTQQGIFSGDSRWYIYQLKDSLIFLPLLSGQTKKVTGVANYQINQGFRRGTDKIKWLAYQLKDTARSLILHHFESGREVRIAGVASYSFDGSGHWLICRKSDGGLLLHPMVGNTAHSVTEIIQYQLEKSGRILLYVKKNETGRQIERMNLADGKVTVLWESADPNITVSSLTIDEKYGRVLFMLQKKKELENTSSIWYWDNDMVKAEERLKDGSEHIAKGLCIGGNPSFTDNGKYILLDLTPLPVAAPKPQINAVQVDIWHYKDTVIQSAQLMYGKNDFQHPWLEQKKYRVVLGVDDTRLVRLENDFEKSGLIVGDWAVVRSQLNTHYLLGLESDNDEMKDSIWLVSLKDGKRLFWHMEYPGTSLDVSPGGRYLLWFDRAQGHYFTRDLKTGRETNVSATVPVYLGSEINADPGARPDNRRTGLLGWLEDDKELLLYDSHDIWQLDPSGLKKPVCITNEYGRRHGIVLRLTEGTGNNAVDHRKLISSDSDLLLTAFNTSTMENGFYRASLRRPGNLEKLYMGPYVLDLTRNLVPNNGDLPSGFIHPLKARDANAWIVSRQSAIEGPNYFLTKDFKTYQALTNINPHKKYNWLTSELVHFKQMDGTMSKGVLYKPENFEPSQKYPVIILYYFQYAQNLHTYWGPDYINNAFTDIPWLVSRGYMVFTPDVYFTRNRPRPASAWNAVEGAGMHLKTFPFIDEKRIGITGHSTAGGFTNYIITHSTQFAAAFEGAGVSNWVSAQYTLIYTNGTARGGAGKGQEPFASNQFILDNPILNADRITSPLLIFHNKMDAAVPWEQGVELYIAMRRLGKPVWMLQYDGQSHNLSKKNAEQDLTIRVTQFFDHYLKGAPAPVWMTRGVPARLKGVETGLELDMHHPRF